MGEHRNEKGNHVEVEGNIKKGKASDMEDRLSHLPEDILVNIMSHLTMKEVTCMNLLSTKWRGLCNLFPGNMDFDASARGWLLLPLELGLGMHRFVKWVNRVLTSHQGPTVEGLRICFDANSDCKEQIDSWIHFAMQKRVKRLDLDLTSAGIYIFPSHLLNHSLGFGSLTTLHLKGVDVTGEVLQSMLLSHCPILEVLSVLDSTNLVSLKISGPALKLKDLNIEQCKNMEDLEVSAVNLVSFRYSGPVIGIPFKNVPHLIEASFGGLFCKSVIDNCDEFASYFLQLETLKLDIGCFFFGGEFPQNFPVLNKLKDLEVMTAVAEANQCLLPCISLLKASPWLLRFKLKILPEIPLRLGYRHRERVLDEHPYPCLQVLEVLGFQGHSVEVGFVQHVLRNAVALEKLIINPCSTFYLKSSSKRCAIELGANLPPGIEFQLI